MRNLKSIIENQLKEIVESTGFNVELCNELKGRRLVTKAEYEKLLKYQKDEQHSEGATYLYLTIVPKFSEALEHSFISALEQSLNAKVVEILRQHSSDEVVSGVKELVCWEHSSSKKTTRISFIGFNTVALAFLTKFEDGAFNSEGRFEGLHFTDEKAANEILTDSWWSQQNVEVEQSGDNQKFIQKVKNTIKCLETETLWWNPKANKLPPNYIPRRAHLVTTETTYEESTPLTTRELIEVNSDFIWLVDPPGMGKSTFTTKLEEEWRETTPSPRVIVRINLNQIQQSLEQMNKDKEDFTLESFLTRFVPFLPVASLNRLAGNPVKVIVLLDALDEVSYLHKAPMIQILHSLLLSPKKFSDQRFASYVLRRPQLAQSLLLVKVFLTTRPHLRSLIEEEFGVPAHSLLPLLYDEQLTYLRREASFLGVSEENAENALLSIPSSARSLMGNPLMLFLVAEVLKSYEVPHDFVVNDIFELYERFVEAKHWLHTVEKKGSDQQKLTSGINLYESNIQFYYNLALDQLSERWIPRLKISLKGQLFKEPKMAKREELLSVGLVILNKNGQFEFIHRSFAEFFYARLLGCQSTRFNLLPNAVLEGVYSAGGLPQVEEFLLCLFPFGILDKQWPIRFFTDLVFLEDVELLERILKGRLFAHFEDIIDVFLSIEDTCEDINDLPTSREEYWFLPKWIYHCEYDEALIKANGIAAIFCQGNKRLLSSASKETIVRALTSCDNLLLKVCRQSPCFEKGREAVENLLTPLQLWEALSTEGSLEATLESRESAWWFAEIVTEKDTLSIPTEFRTELIEIVGSKRREMELAWGDSFLGDLLSFRFELDNASGRGIMSDNECKLIIEEEVREPETNFDLLKAAVFSHQETFEEDRLEICSISDGTTLMKKSTDAMACDVNADMLNDSMDEINFLPYAIRYGTLEIVKKHVTTIPDMSADNAFFLETLPTALILSLLVDKTDETFDHLVSIIKETQSRSPRELGEVLSNLLRCEIIDLRRATGQCFPDDQLPPVCQVSWGEVLIRLLPTVVFHISQYSLELASGNFLKRSTTPNLADILDLVIHEFPSLLYFLLREAGMEASKGRHTCSPKFWGVLQFLQKYDGVKLSWLTENSTVSSLMEIIVNCYILIDPNSTDWAEVSDLIHAIGEKVINCIQGSGDKFTRLLIYFPQYQSEREWEVVLYTLNLIDEDCLADGATLVYEDSGTALLRVLLRIFGEEETRRVAEEEILPQISQSRNNCFSGQGEWVFGGVDTVEPAVDLGSLLVLEEVAWPSLLKWRNQEKQSFMQVAEAKWEDDHEVTDFLRCKFELRFNI